ncbi:DAHP synthetase/Phospho-2-dehydro-3-deoxyheptonate aldolase [Paracholeplasma brassicae]|jgi:3-deoxy-7-phosphoheptulonate synthase|uniref:DAHP synthetase/Phospho-2-dehydro-3-deoxyheptonate aldolase n=1 Tax=Acholeplasma brassicae TaxID=61635 RepID=U4KMI4_9MOLU|nr:3-deoxy-7-phosphoheptulonate synthase [Paracholeplasma brassicae]CCV65367.1 DAHP synthetase/Phospho-2-dehydro-3-deoxyheptonate aldolase [Paracholeplasma brassicae]
MIVTMQQNATKQNFEKITTYLMNKGYGIKDSSSENLMVFGVIGDTKSLNPNDLEAFEGVKNVTRVSTPYKLASRSFKKTDTIITLANGTVIGADQFVVMAGPCSVESYENTLEIAKSASKSGATILRGGAYKPRTSPYAFQGMGIDGLKILREVADKFNMAVVSEIMSEDLIEAFEPYVDIYQIGTRNMQNYNLLKQLGARTQKPILLKRGMSATIEEWLMSAEYIMASGNENVILCERGIRTFEKYTRNTLDISAVLAIKELSHLPIVIDPSHAAGKYSMIERLSMASQAVGADGIIVEIHPDPEHALSDGAQSLKLEKFDSMMGKLKELSSVLDKKVK